MLVLRHGRLVRPARGRRLNCETHLSFKTDHRLFIPAPSTPTNGLHFYSGKSNYCSVDFVKWFVRLIKEVCSVSELRSLRDRSLQKLN